MDVKKKHGEGKRVGSREEGRGQSVGSKTKKSDP